MSLLLQKEGYVLLLLVAFLSLTIHLSAFLDVFWECIFNSK